MSDISPDRRRFLSGIVSLSLTGVLANGPLLAAPASPTEAEWFSLLANLRGFPGAFRYTLRVQAHRNGITEENIADVFFHSHRKVLILFQAPQTVAGRRILISDDDMWLGMPTSKRILRILPSQRLLGEASNGDIINTDFERYRLAEQAQDTYNGAPVLKLRLEAKEAVSFYPRIDYLIDTTRGLPKASRHYSASGKLLKTIEYASFSGEGKSTKLQSLRIFSAVTPGQSTLMTFNDYAPADLPRGLFVRENLLTVDPRAE